MLGNMNMINIIGGTMQRETLITGASEASLGSTVKAVLSDHVWALKKWSLNTGALLIKGACIVWLSFGTSGSGVAQDRWSLNTSGHKTGFTV